MKGTLDTHLGNVAIDNNVIAEHAVRAYYDLRSGFLCANVDVPSHRGIVPNNHSDVVSFTTDKASMAHNNPLTNFNLSTISANKQLQVLHSRIAANDKFMTLTRYILLDSSTTTKILYFDYAHSIWNRLHPPGKTPQTVMRTY